jgi:hypothetical protein
MEKPYKFYGFLSKVSNLAKFNQEMAQIRYQRVFYLNSRWAETL